MSDQPQPNLSDDPPSVGPPQVMDSGHRREFPTGAVRDMAEGKGRFDLLPMLSLRAVAKVCEMGAIKYGERNCEKGIPLHSFIDSAMRHIACVMEGMVDEPHAAQAAWNMLMFVQTREMIDRGLLPASLNDLPNYMPALGSSSMTDRPYESRIKALSPSTLQDGEVAHVLHWDATQAHGDLRVTLFAGGPARPGDILFIPGARVCLCVLGVAPVKDGVQMVTVHRDVRFKVSNMKVIRLCVADGDSPLRSRILQAVRSSLVTHFDCTGETLEIEVAKAKLDGVCEWMDMGARPTTPHKATHP